MIYQTILSKVHYFVISVALLSFGCAKNIVADKPTEAYVVKEYKPEYSSISIPVEIELSQINKLVNNSLKGLLYEDNSLENNGGDNLMLKVYKQEDITIKALGDLIMYRVPLKIWLKGGFKVEQFGIPISHYEETEFAIALNFETKVALNANYGINTQTQIKSYDWIQKPTLKWGPFEIPLNNVVDVLIKTQQSKLTPIIDEQAQQAVDLKKYVVDAWKMIQKPIEVSSVYKTNLKITPSEIFMTPINGQSGKLNSTIGIKAITEVLVGDAPLASNVALPNLKIVKAAGNAFSIVMAADLTFAAAKELAKASLVNKTFNFEGKKSITITDFDLYGSNDKIIVKVDMIGSLKGTVYLSGIPKYDQASASIYLDALDYDISTKNVLAKSANWMAHDKFVKIMAPYFKYSIAQQLKDSKDLLQKALTNNRVASNVLLNGKLVDLSPREIYITNNALKTIVDVKGIIGVAVDGLDK
ncbi:MAG: hypothetical protein RL060_1320 [Bacteroidota bacterium]